MAKRLTVEEAIRKVIDTVNLLKDPESADLEKYMNRYASLRDLEGKDREEAYQTIATALFGGYEWESLPDETEALPEEPEPAEPEAIQEEAGWPDPMDHPEEPEGSIEPDETHDGPEDAGHPEVTEGQPLTETKERPAPYHLTVADFLRMAGKAWGCVLSLWDNTAATFEATWEVFILPTLLILLAFWQTSGVALWGFRKVQGVAPYLLWAVRKGQEALPDIGRILMQGTGFMACIGLLVASGAIHAGKAIKAGWQMRRELVDEWKEAA